VRRSLKSGRLVLDEKSVGVLNDMMGALLSESPYLNISPSKVVGLILSEYQQKFFEKEKGELSARLIDKKSYLKHAVATAESDEELMEMIAKIGVVGSRKVKKRASKAKKEVSDTLDRECEL